MAYLRSCPKKNRERMKKIVKIAKIELSILFYSPIAWLLLVIFLIQAGLAYTDMLYSQETQQQLGRRLNVLTKVLFAGENGMLASIQGQLYLYIPLLTMGLMSRETSSGSIKLLYSSPITVSQIILGKYLSIMLYNLALVAILLIFIPISIFSIENVDVTFVLGGIFGLYLLMCVYAAIGLFMSSLTSYQVVAAISTLAVLAILNFIGSVGQEYDVVRDITYWFSISGRADNFVNGLISSKDLIYFLSVIILFLVLCILKLNNERKRKTKTIKVIQYSSLIIGVIIIGYVSTLPTINGYLDTTRFKDRTLTKTSQEIVKKFPKPISITTYVNIVDYTAETGSPENRIKDLAQFENFRRFLPHLKMEYIYYYDSTMYNRDTTMSLIEKAKKAARVLHLDFDEILPPSEIKKQVDLLPEKNRLVRFINYDNKSIPLRMFDDIFRYPGEKDIISKLKTFIEEPGKVGVLAGNGERSTNSLAENSYKIITKGVNVRGSLINAGFDILDLKLDTINKIPLTLDVLIIADPKIEYTETQLIKINKYIKEGGNLLIAGEPRKEYILNPLLNKLGVNFTEGTLLQKNENYDADLIQGKFTPEAKELGFSFYDDATVTLPNATNLEIKNNQEYTITPLLIGKKELTYNNLQDFDLKTQKINFDSIPNSQMDANLAMVLTKDINNKQQKIIVIGDADFMSLSELNRNNLKNVNTSLAIKMFKWFSDNEYPVSVSRPGAIDTKIKITRTEINWLKAIVFAIIPLCIILFGSILLIRRRRK